MLREETRTEEERKEMEGGECRELFGKRKDEGGERERERNRSTHRHLLNRKLEMYGAKRGRFVPKRDDLELKENEGREGGKGRQGQLRSCAIESHLFLP